MASPPDDAPNTTEESRTSGTRPSKDIIEKPESAGEEATANYSYSILLTAIISIKGVSYASENKRKAKASASASAKKQVNKATCR
jgi:hypothetical protein